MRGTLICVHLALVGACLAGCSAGTSWSLGFSTDLLGDHGEPVMLDARFKLTVERNPFGPLEAWSETPRVLRILGQDTCPGSSVEPDEFQEELQDWEAEMEDCQDEGQSWEDCEEQVGAQPREPDPYDDECPTEARLHAVGEGTGIIRWETTGGHLADTWRIGVARADRIEAEPVELPGMVPYREGETLPVFHGSPLGLRVRFYAEGGDGVMQRRDPQQVLFGDREPDESSVTDDHDLYSVDSIPHGIDAVRFDMAPSDRDFALPVEEVREADVEDLRLRRMSTHEPDERWRCYDLQAYGRIDREPVIGVPIAWSCGPLIRLFPSPYTATACLPDQVLPEPVLAATAFPFGPATERWLPSERGPPGEHEATITGQETLPGEAEPERPLGAVGCETAGGAGETPLLALLLLALRRRCRDEPGPPRRAGGRPAGRAVLAGALLAGCGGPKVPHQDGSVHLETDLVGSAEEPIVLGAVFTVRTSRNPRDGGLPETAPTGRRGTLPIEVPAAGGDGGSARGIRSSSQAARLPPAGELAGRGRRPRIDGRHHGRESIAATE